MQPDKNTNIAAQQLKALRDLTELIVEISDNIDESNNASYDFNNKLGSLVLDIRETLNKLSKKEKQEKEPDYKPIVAAIKKLESKLDFRPEVNVEDPVVKVNTDVDKLIKSLETNVAQYFKDAIQLIPKVPKTDLSKSESLLSDVLEQLGSIDTGVRLKPEFPNSFQVSNYTAPSADTDHNTLQAINEIFSTYGDTVSVDNKKKSLLKFGSRTTVGTTWETLMTEQGTEVGETFVSGNNITHIVSSTTDTQTVNIEYHTVSAGVTTFGVQSATLNGTTPVALTTPAYRVSRVYNTGSTPLAGTIYIYEGGTRTDANTHITIPAGEQQTQKAQTTISDNDYWVITFISLSVLAKVTKYAEARLEIKPVAQSYWRPITQTFAATDTTGTILIKTEPYLIVPSNYDVRLAVKTNTSAVSIAGGFGGYLAN